MTNRAKRRGLRYDEENWTAEKEAMKNEGSFSPRCGGNSDSLSALVSRFFCRRRLPAKRRRAAAQGPLPVNVVTVEEKEVREWDEFTGRLEAVESVDIRPRVSGYITEIHFQAGAIIKKVDLLYVIDPRPYQADFDRAAAEFERLQAQQKLAQIELDRAKDLRAKNTISASEFDQKAATYQSAEAAARSAEAAKNAAALNLEFTQIKSPIDGRVSDARITLGNLVQPGRRPESVLTTVVSVDPIYARIDADENAVLKYVKLSEEGKRVSARTEKIAALIQLGNETGFPHEGVIDFVDNRLDPGTGTLRARVVLKNWNPSFITPGLFRSRAYRRRRAISRRLGARQSDQLPAEREIRLRGQTRWHDRTPQRRNWQSFRRQTNR